MRLCQIFFVLFLFPLVANASVTSDLALWDSQRSAGSPDPSSVAYLARQYPEWPGLAAMVSKIEDQQSYGGLGPADIAALFSQRRPRTESGMIAYIKARGTSPQARTELARIWREEPLNKSMQKTIKDRFGEMLTMDDNIIRLDMLLDTNNPLLATDLSMMMGGPATQYTITRIGINKGEITSYNNLPASYQRDGRVMGEFLRKAAAREDVGNGAYIARQMGAMTSANAAAVWKSRHLLARAALEQNRVQDAYMLAVDNHLRGGSEFAESQFLSGFIAYKGLRNPTQALQHFQNMYQNVDSVISKSRAAYWAGRAAQAANQPQIAQQWFETAARFPTTFFGQRGLEALHRKLSRSEINAMQDIGQSKFASDESIVTGARYFYNKHDEAAARQFLMAGAAKAGSTGDYKRLYAVASDFDDRNIQVKLARKEGVAGLVPPASGFPRMTADEREQARMGGMTNMALVSAIVRQESEFDPMAQSGAGARGMMQLMPGTASETARKQGIAHHVDWLQTKPQHNIRLGATYLASLLERFDGSMVLAVAAYNAGPGRVNQWIERFGDPRTNQIATEDWIELIPVGETRNYIQRVQEGEAVYSAL